LADRPTELLNQYRDLVLHWSRRVNIVGPEARENIEAHIKEALQASAILKPSGIVLDFGSGGGLPAIPMAIVSPEVEFHLVEADQKKWAFLKHVARECQLNCRIWGDRLTRALAVMPSTLRFDLVTSRAVGRPQEWVPELLGRMQSDGRVALFQSEPSSSEIKGFEQIRSSRLSRGDSNYLVELRRTSE